MATVGSGGCCLVVNLLKSSRCCGELNALVRQDPTVGAQGLGGAAEGSLGCGRDGGGTEDLVRALYSMARCRVGQVIAEVSQVGLGTRGITEAKVPQHPV